jgi:hypothetical protein
LWPQSAFWLPDKNTFYEGYKGRVVQGMTTFDTLTDGAHAVADIFAFGEEGMRVCIYFVFYHVSVLFYVVFPDDLSEFFGFQELARVATLRRVWKTN